MTGRVSTSARRFFRVAAVCAAVHAAAGISAAQDRAGSEPDREIVPIRDDLYRVRDGTQYTVFLVTPEGIILGDPLTRAAALWLRDELASRFPGTPVRYVLHSHLTYERAQGASVFDGTAERVAHGAFDGQWEKARRHLPETLVPLDRNGNGRLSREELAGTLHEDMIRPTIRTGTEASRRWSSSMGWGRPRAATTRTGRSASAAGPWSSFTSGCVTRQT
jgi:hypothetical protein